MPIDWRWYNDQHTIICFIFKDPWSLDEFITADTETEQAIQELDWIVDAIMDLSQARIVPRNTLSGMLSMVKRSETVPNMGSSVVIKPNQLLKSLIYSLQKIVSREAVFIAEDFDEAEHIITELQSKRG